MTAAALDRIPVGDITDRARQIQFGKTVLNLLAAVILGAAWVAAKSATLGWLALAWCFAAAEMGWKQGRGKSAVLLPSRTALAEENAVLREELRRRGG